MVHVQTHNLIGLRALLFLLRVLHQMNEKLLRLHKDPRQSHLNLKLLLGVLLFAQYYQRLSTLEFPLQWPPLALVALASKYRTERPDQVELTFSRMQEGAVLLD